MSSFTSPLRVEVEQRDTRAIVVVRLLEAFTYEKSFKGSGEFVVVPKDFKSDVTSVPRLFWMLEPPIGRAAKASILHDYLYSLRYDRREADNLYREALAVLQVGVVKRNILWFGVRIGGGWNYHNKPTVP